MMKLPILKDRFDYCTGGGLILVLVALAILLATAEPSKVGADSDRRLEQELMAQARLSFLQSNYSPVVELGKRGELQTALLKLEELDQKFPGEPYGSLLRGEVLFRMGVVDRALVSLAVAVRGNSEFLDRANPINRHDLVVAAVEQGIPLLRDRQNGQPDDRQVAAALKDAYYLKSRLAGGCE
jgi:predicted Zn-dependent protease